MDDGELVERLTRRGIRHSIDTTRRQEGEREK
jgi:hypothetical protein